jgi:hypothetical protein
LQKSHGILNRLLNPKKVENEKKENQAKIKRVRSPRQQRDVNKLS